MSKNKNTQPKKDKSQKKAKKKYGIRNWKEYNESLVNRGRIDVYIDKEMEDGWYIAHGKDKSKKPGKPKKYSDLAIQLTLQLGKVFHQRLRQTEGLVKSTFKMLELDLDVPDYSTLSRRLSDLNVQLPTLPKENIVIIMDSTGLKIYGEGEWKVRKHGWSKHRTWRKGHIAVTPDGEVRVAKLTGNNTSDSEVFGDLLDQEEATIETISADGAYDTKNVYDICQEKNISNILIPPQRNAKIWQHGNLKSKPHPRDENLREIRRTSRKKWKESVGYHVRSLSETAMFRFKTIFGGTLNSRKFKNQQNEFLIAISAMNKMTRLGMPDSYVIE